MLTDCLCWSHEKDGLNTLNSSFDGGYWEIALIRGIDNFNRWRHLILHNFPQLTSQSRSILLPRKCQFNPLLYQINWHSVHDQNQNRDWRNSWILFTDWQRTARSSVLQKMFFFVLFFLLFLKFIFELNFFPDPH